MHQLLFLAKDGTSELRGLFLSLSFASNPSRICGMRLLDLLKRRCRMGTEVRERGVMDTRMYKKSDGVSVCACVSCPVLRGKRKVEAVMSV